MKPVLTSAKLMAKAAKACASATTLLEKDDVEAEDAERVVADALEFVTCVGSMLDDEAV